MKTNQAVDADAAVANTITTGTCATTVDTMSQFGTLAKLAPINRSAHTTMMVSIVRTRNSMRRQDGM